MEPAWDRFDFAVDVSSVYDLKMNALRAYESVFLRTVDIYREAIDLFHASAKTRKYLRSDIDSGEFKLFRNYHLPDKFRKKQVIEISCANRPR